MHSRLIFRPRLERTKVRATQTLMTWQPEATAEGVCGDQLPGKASKLSPYRKPTQVSGMSILRRVS